jgi:hypothetical protein
MVRYSNTLQSYVKTQVHSGPIVSSGSITGLCLLPGHIAVFYQRITFWFDTVVKKVREKWTQLSFSLSLSLSLKRVYCITRREILVNLKEINTDLNG